MACAKGLGAYLSIFQRIAHFPTLHFCKQMPKHLISSVPNTSHISKLHSAVNSLPMLSSLSSGSIKSMNHLDSGFLALSATYISVRHKGKKGKWAVSPTKNRSGRPPGKSRGLKVYDGQRVPCGTMLVNQIRPAIFPGWNVSELYITCLFQINCILGNSA